MPNITIICFLSSILFYGMGFLKMQVFKNAALEQVSTYDYSILVSLTTVYFSLAIFLAAIGFLFFYAKNSENKTLWKFDDCDCRDQLTYAMKDQNIRGAYP